MKYLKTYLMQSESNKLYEQNKPITRLDYSNQKLSELPPLPNSLKELDCSNNNLSELPPLLDSLKELDCSNNNLTELPELPDSLKRLYCFDNNLPFYELNGYKQWYKENKHIIEENGLSYAYQLYNSTKKYNI